MIFLYAKNPNKKIGGVEYVINLLLQNNKESRWESSVANLIFSKRERIIIFNSYTLSNIFYFILLCAFKIKVFWVPCFHDFDDQFKQRSWIKKIIKKVIFEKIIIKLANFCVEKIIVFSKKEYFTFTDIYKFSSNDVQIVYLPSKYEMTRRHSSSKLYFSGFVGRWVSNKGIDVIEKLLVDKKLSWVISPSIPNKIKNICKTLDILYIESATDDDIEYYLSNTKFILVPSRSESYGLLLAESLDCGANVIFSNAPVSNSIKNPENLNLNEIHSYEDWYDLPLNDFEFVYDLPKIEYHFPSIIEVLKNED